MLLLRFVNEDRKIKTRNRFDVCVLSNEKKGCEREGEKHEMLSQLSNTNTKSFLGTESLGRWCNLSYSFVCGEFFHEFAWESFLKTGNRTVINESSPSCGILSRALFPNTNRNPVFSTLLFNTTYTMWCCPTPFSNTVIFRSYGGSQSMIDDQQHETNTA